MPVVAGRPPATPTPGSLATDTELAVGLAAHAATTHARGVDPLRRVPEPSHSMVAPACVAAHGWAAGSGNTGTITDDTTDVMIGSRAVKVVTNGAAGVARLDHTGLSFTMTDRCPVLWVQVDDTTKLDRIELYLGDDGFANFYRLDFESPTAASTGDRYLESGTWHRMVLGWDGLAFSSGSPSRAQTFTTVRVAVIDEGSAAVTVRVGGFGWQAEPTTTYPLGVVSFTFDDGYVSQYDEALPILSRYGYPATAYPIVDLVGSSASFVTVDQLTELQNVHGWEVGAHAYTDATHTARLTGLSAAAAESDLAANKRWLIDNGFTGPTHAYPGGQSDATVRGLAAQYFTASRSQHSYTREVVPPGEPHRMRTRAMGATQTLATATAVVDAAVANHQWGVFTFHKLVTTAADAGLEWGIADFSDLVDYCHTAGVAVRTVADVTGRVTL